KALSEAMAQAEAANKSKSRFLAAASHDLMQPFNALSLFTDMLRQKVSGTEAEDLAKNIQDSLGIVESLVSDLVEISKLEAATLKADISVFNLDELLTPLVNEYSIVAKTQSIGFKARKSSVFVNTDKRLVRRIIQNLLTNAIHYTPASKASEGPKILLGIKRYKQHIQIQVWDNGPGIPEQNQTLIFQEFERLEQNREVPGLGLGLTISDRIAKLLGLRLGMKSIVGKGSMFFLEIPITTQHASETSEAMNLKLTETASQENDPFRDLVVVLIDNDELLLEALKQQLAQWSDHVIAVRSFQEWQNINQTEHIKPDVILADYHLDDGENGIHVAQTILKQLETNIPVIICSADASEWLREAVSEANYSFIRKPLKSLALRKLILKQLNSSAV
ncbi:MAG: hybrid sensor histidine kinase/response regulator, partial [Gammaproteobacteria bacterium]|nr:hybrid sensor histidine kinase/response regulator [Gammaproteobacteria bacterium]